MKNTEYIWHGASGYTPGAGHLDHGESYLVPERISQTVADRLIEEKKLVPAEIEPISKPSKGKTIADKSEV